MMKWSLSAHRIFRRCQRQYFFSQILPWHKGNPVRVEAYILKQLKPLSTWQGLIVHQGIKEFLVPILESRNPIEWNSIYAQTIDLALRQFEFSRKRRFRERGITKTSCNGEYCALIEHEIGIEIPESSLKEVSENIKKCFENFSAQEDLLSHIKGRKRYYAEIPISCQYENTQIQISPDLVFYRDYGKSTIIDWKVEKDSTSADHTMQTALYGWVLLNNENWGVRQAGDIELIEVQLLNGYFIRSEGTTEIFEEVEDIIYRSIHEIRALCGSGKFDDQTLDNYEFAQNPNTCKYCSFTSLCKELNHGLSRPIPIRDHKLKSPQRTLPGF